MYVTLDYYLMRKKILLKSCKRDFIYSCVLFSSMIFYISHLGTITWKEPLSAAEKGKNRPCSQYKTVHFNLWLHKNLFWHLVHSIKRISSGCFISRPGAVSNVKQWRDEPLITLSLPRGSPLTSKIVWR